MMRVEPHAPSVGEYQWVYLWHWPLRAMHWIAAVCLVVLVVTGFMIGKPYFLPSAEVGAPFWIGWVRFLHFGAAGLLVMTGIVRAYWLLAGNRFERLPALFPVRPRDWVNLVRQVKFYLMIDVEKAPHYLGHNPLQQWFYTMVYVVTGIMVVTGFAMYGQSSPGGLVHAAFGWVGPALGGIQYVRLVHHVLTWFYPLFVVFHIYLAVRSDLLERTGTMSSVVSGGRFVPTDRHYVDG